MNTATEQTTMNSKANGKQEPSSLTRELPLTLLDESPTQPRKTFVGIEELAKGIGDHGVLQPIVVRPKGKRFEIVFGARRFRASKLAKLTTIPATIRELDDAKALELQIIENSQREDVHPLEEADGYQTLHQKHGYTVDEISAKVGKPTTYIYARLKLTTLIPEARNAFFDGRLTPATALLIARIPHADLQKKALAEITKKGWNQELPSAREATRIIKSQFMLRLVDAPFDRADATLVPSAGACAACPKRTGNQKELFADLESKDDLCTDPKCFTQKRVVAGDRKIEAAKTAGIEVLADKQAKKLFVDGGYVKHDAGFVDLDAPTHTGAGKETTKRALLGKADVKVVIARDLDGKVHELVSAKDFAKATKQPAPKPSKTEQRWNAEREAQKKKVAKEKEKAEAQIVAVVAAAERRQPNDAFWRTLAMTAIADFDAELEDILERRNLLSKDDTKSDPLELAQAALKKMTGGQARGLFIEAWLRSYGPPEKLESFVTFYGVKAGAKTAKAPKKKTATAKKR